MTRLLPPRQRARLAFLAIVVLFWTQLAMAMHPGCAGTSGTMPRSDAAALASIAVIPGHGATAPEHAVCPSHCSQGELNSEIARIPLLPPMLAAQMVRIVEVATLPGMRPFRRDSLDGPPFVSWHRPTPHPAALLLI